MPSRRSELPTGEGISRLQAPSASDVRGRDGPLASARSGVTERPLRHHQYVDPWGTTPCEYAVVPLVGDAVAALIAELTRTHVNGGVLLARVRAVGISDPSTWFMTGSNLAANTSFRDLFD